MDIQYTYDCKLKKIREMLLTTLEHNQHDVIDVICRLPFWNVKIRRYLASFRLQVWYNNFRELDMILEIISKAGLKAKPEKCQLLEKEVTFLGHLVSDKGIQQNRYGIDLEMIWLEKINKIKSCMEVWKLRGFIRYLHYSSRL